MIDIWSDKLLVIVLRFWKIKLSLLVFKYLRIVLNLGFIFFIHSFFYLFTFLLLFTSYLFKLLNTELWVIIIDRQKLLKLFLSNIFKFSLQSKICLVLLYWTTINSFTIRSVSLHKGALCWYLIFLILIAFYQSSINLTISAVLTSSGFSSADKLDKFLLCYFLQCFSYKIMWRFIYKSIFVK